MQSSSRLSFAACVCAVLTLALHAPAAEAQNKGKKPGSGGDTGGDTGGSLYLSFASDHNEVNAGDSVRLSWASIGARHCFASGDWSGKLAPEGAYTTTPLDGSKSYTLECKTGGNAVVQTVVVAVTSVAEEPATSDPVIVEEPQQEPDTSLVETTPPEESGPIDDSTTGDTSSETDTSLVETTAPEPTPSLALQAYDAEVRTGETATITWAGASVSNCQASGAWSGARAASGTETIGPLNGDASFTLTCESSAGRLMAMTSVLVTDGGTTLSWVPPAENVDGSALTDLKGYRIYVGTTSRNYSSQIDLPNPGLTDYFVQLSRGEYYVAMTAIDAEGNESGYSNEVLKAVN